jgi:uncharacterized SAM-binding protein YcdF (DUF218 family)
MTRKILVGLAIVLLVVVLARHAGSYLVVSAPEHADLIVVLAGGNNDLRYWTGLRLMDEGLAPRLMLDVFDKGVSFGNKDIDLAQGFVQKTGGGRATVCAIAQNSTYDEARYLADCLRGSNIKSILVVTSAYHTRRTIEIFKKRLPQYQISVYAADDPYFFNTKWWQTREWAKTTLAEWQRYLWWLFVDQWRSGMAVSGS